ncbi:hypothetical protein FACS1894139_18270 [Planctomycetales bacterium]|nr:hypothetical protein FACS1894107_14540 [Planctomycetales bacterium]GHT08511.1 hypothetical protein FACS1894139_18270 [Planctomycetales bacterium]
MAKATKTGQFIYIVQAILEPSKCKIGKTDNPERRLKEYNSITGKSKDNHYAYLFVAQVSDMAQMEKAITERFRILREEKSREIYFYNHELFRQYVDYIKKSPWFVQEVFIKPTTPKTITKIVKRITPTLKERGLTRKELLQKAQKVDDDEFYTLYEDLEKEVACYDKRIWRNKVVFCNCDDPVGGDETRTSAFALYFINHFKDFGLKKLICTHYSGEVDLFNAGASGYIFTKYGFNELDVKKESPKGYTGAFEDPLSIKILNDEADIVCTNPPFSRAIDYWKLIIGSGKQFLIVSAITNSINTAFIPYFKNKTVWAGHNRIDHFLNPKRQLVEASGHWYCNLPIKNRAKLEHLKIIPLKDIPDAEKSYDDNKTLLVSNCCIPSDYKKPFAVSARPILNGVLECGYEIVADKRYTPYIDGKEKFARVLIQKA